MNTITSDNARVKLHVHGGGSGGSSHYVVYLTEGEAYSIIQAEANAAGLKIIGSYVEPRFFISKRHKNAFRLRADDSREDLWRFMHSRSERFMLRQIFLENGGQGMPWNDFLRLLKERVEPTVFNDNQTSVRLHHGGEGSSFYVVYLTEHDAYANIQAQAKAAGLQIDVESFIDVQRGTDDVIKHHKNAFIIETDSHSNDLWRLMHYTGGPLKNSPLAEAFKKSEDKAVLWEDFLRLLKEQGETENP